MPKVDLDKITLGVSPLTNSVYAGVSKKNPKGPGMMWLHKSNVTQSFLDCVIQRWDGQREVIGAGDNRWEITVKKIK